ncbi:DNA-binding MarR family transcriptional regulator [Pseudomonas duriflava]|uniref:DNA-binding MarR family transcriptional regulator n=1 Tax=Pseudomonas duriflava TaxID=459528 RepID=A0A562Q776_9PSED|nr:MarR family transcriptional regulator [Pseudomonas duriflava]TWI52564.1 DNA-binding MarR family transcriptional regulator [Pseudomonas duriflava]
MEERIAELFADITDAFQGRMKDAAHLESTGLAHFQVRALAFVAKRPEARPRDLIERSGRDQAQITRVVRDLEEHGLIERSPDPLDRRAILLRLTAQGKEVYDLLNSRRKVVIAQMLRHLDSAQRALLVDMLARMKQGLANDATDSTLSNEQSGAEDTSGRSAP